MLISKAIPRRLEISIVSLQSRKWSSSLSLFVPMATARCTSWVRSLSAVVLFPTLGSISASSLSAMSSRFRPTPRGMHSAMLRIVQLHSPRWVRSRLSAPLKSMFRSSIVRPIVTRLFRPWIRRPVCRWSTSSAPPWLTWKRVSRRVSSLLLMRSNLPRLVTVYGQLRGDYIFWWLGSKIRVSNSNSWKPIKGYWLLETDGQNFGIVDVIKEATSL